jgi:hypothetical protein
MCRLLYNERGTKDEGQMKVTSSESRVQSCNATRKSLFSIFLIIIIFSIFQFSDSFAQSPNYSLIKTIPFKGTYMKMDNFGSTYVVNEKNELHKFKANGDFVHFYSIVGIGKIGFVDVSNPRKVLTYYPRYTTIKILDVTLSDKGSVNLLNSGFDRVNALCLSLDNNIWIYDEITFRLKKLNDNLDIIRQSEDLTTLLQAPVKPNFILEKDNLLFVNDPEIGILVFDIYSTYIKTIPIKGLKEFQKLKDQIFYFHEGKMQSYHLKALQFSEIQLPEINDSIIDVKIQAEHLAILTQNELLLYSYTISQK